MGTAAAELASLGVIVDGSGARREIKLTREELISLANGGKFAEDALKKAIPPTIVPPNVPSQINALTEAIKRMRQAAAQGRANAMASQIGILDPFQGGGFGGPQLGPALPNTIAQAGAAAGRAAPNFDRMRSSLTQIAISAAGIPGPVGRLASVLGQFAFGGAITVGVIAGAAAIGFAWERMTRQSREAKEALEKQLTVLRDLKRQQDLGPTGEAGAATGAARGRLGTVLGELRPMNELIAGASAAGAWDYAGQLERRRTALVKEASELVRLIGAGEKDITRITTEEAEKRETEARRRFDEKWARLRAEADRQVELERSIAQGIARMLADAADEAEKFGRAFSPAALPSQSILSPEFLASIEKHIELTILGLDKLSQKQKNMAGAAGMVGQWGLGKLAGSGGAAGAVGSAGLGAMSGAQFGVPGAVAGGFLGLMDGIMRAGEASKAYREELRRIEAAYQSFVDTARLGLGDISQMEFDVSAIKRQFDEAIAAAGYTRELIEQIRSHSPNAQGDFQRMLELLELERRMIEKRRQEADEIERYLNLTRNAPAGFFVAKYLRDIGAPSSAPGSGVRPRGGGSGAGRGRETTAVIEININGGTGSPREITLAVTQGLQQFVNSSGGAGMTLAEALERFN